jgi:hypothetical protein
MGMSPAGRRKNYPSGFATRRISRTRIMPRQYSGPCPNPGTFQPHWLDAPRPAYEVAKFDGDGNQIGVEKVPAFLGKAQPFGCQKCGWAHT